jgi:hypothetical protein
MQKIAKFFLLTPFLASGALATSPTYLQPSDVLARLSQFDGGFVAVGGRLQIDSAARCLTVGEGIWAGRFAVHPVEAIGIREHRAHLAGRFVIVEGTLRVSPPTEAANNTPSCSNARIEGVAIREATRQEVSPFHP